ncbi:hypothetical protein [Oceanimonas marisflavi]|uniref:hypothetical protein n=1 Tax=Oceanimonas marisflavi TaxID=2059724 RepID=UPI0018E5A047|nr:hypothetical protein [Oceanimonas marisflavi]
MIPLYRYAGLHRACLAVTLMCVTGLASADDQALIASAISAAPEAVGRDAAVVIVDAEGNFKTLKEGTNNFTCMPDDPGSPANDPMCVDENGLEWVKAWINKTPPPAGKLGFAYMLAGGGAASNTDPFASQPAEGRTHLKEPPHIMIFNTSEAMQGYPDPGADPDTSQPWIMWRGTPYEHLMIPVE